MANRIPPIASLRALEAAARHLSYTQAARELNVTQSAVSHQIKHAEELLDLTLFERRGRGLIMTDAAQTLVPVVRDFLKGITTAVENLKEQRSPESLRVTLVQSFAFKWLVPRLKNFTRLHPEVDIWISTTDNLVDFNIEQADVGIRLGKGDWPQIYEVKLLEEYVFPVCSPRFAQEYGLPDTPADLLNFPLMRRDLGDICPRWKDWFRDAGVEVKRMQAGTRYPDTSLAVQAAIDDQGVALARSAHVADDLKAGRLLQVFPEICSRSNVAYYFTCASGRQDEPTIKAFLQWLQVEAEIGQKEFDQFLNVAASKE